MAKTIPVPIHTPESQKTTVGSAFGRWFPLLWRYSVSLTLSYTRNLFFVARFFFNLFVGMPHWRFQLKFTQFLPNFPNSWQKIPIFGKKNKYFLPKSTQFLVEITHVLPKIPNSSQKYPIFRKCTQILAKKYPILDKNTQSLSKNSQLLSRNSHSLSKNM